MLDKIIKIPVAVYLVGLLSFKIRIDVLIFTSTFDHLVLSSCRQNLHDDFVAGLEVARRGPPPGDLFSPADGVFRHTPRREGPHHSDHSRATSLGRSRSAVPHTLVVKSANKIQNIRVKEAISEEVSANFGMP